ncbi:hypothetical protein GOP47_0021107 [Adiantum capillus-veneris]|uniref:glutathione transferase n=1 Tax=Adiantum capillus-veneris TaxID=13818 RepID=A0A9D4UB92_ADICA|nr:hypothetical protein GOP47_0021107 [Adiantum capillus-veneris]
MDVEEAGGRVMDVEEGAGGAEVVQLLNLWASPFAMSCAIALNIKGVAFTYVDEDIPYQKSPLLLQSNPVYKEVPVLIHNDKPVSQSLVILEYIEEAWPPSWDAAGGAQRAALLPGKARLNALARFWAQYGNCKFIETGLKLMKKVGEEHEAARRDIVEQFFWFEKGLAETAAESAGGGNAGPFFFGNDCPCLPDIVMASLVSWKETYESLGAFTFPGPEQCPRMHRWLSAMAQLPAVTPAVPDKARLLTHCTLFREAVIQAAAAAKS